MSDAVTFLAETFSTLEVKSFIDENKDCWFQLSHVCKVLGYANSTDAMNYHTDEDERQLIEPMAGMKVWFISEEGLYGLILGSKKKEAKLFKKWVKNVLKKLRNQGYYIARVDDETLARLQAEKDHLQAELDKAKLDTNYTMTQFLLKEVRYRDEDLTRAAQYNTKKSTEVKRLTHLIYEMCGWDMDKGDKIIRENNHIRANRLYEIEQFGYND